VHVPTEQPDAELSARLDRLAGGGWRRIAAASVDLADSTPVRLAGLGTGLHGCFEIGSVTKAMTGMLLAVAAGRNELCLDSTVGDLQPSLSGTGLAKTTMRELCTHSSGLPRLPRDLRTTARATLFALTGADPYRGTTAARVMWLAGRQALTGKGSFRYSNLGAALAGQLLAQGAGQDFPALLGERILAPLGMTNTAVATTRARAPHGWSAGGVPRAPWVFDGYAPAGGVIATIGDMARFAAGLLQGNAPGADSMRALPGTALPGTALPGTATAGTSRRRGMFWVIDRAGAGELVWHNGATGGYSAFIGLRPDASRAVIVLAAKSQPGRLEEIALRLLDGAR
jgi:CubicO group peptidase (beta-lactamase class C family)